MLKSLASAHLTRRQIALFGLRGFVHAMGVILWFFAMTQIPIADVTAMNYLSPVYVAIGNSITHGTGQKAGYETYPFIVSQKKGWDLYNVAVGGSKISWPVAKMLSDKHIDVITILWGYNDWNAGFTPKGEIIPRYSKLLKILAKDHPDAKIYCILPTATKATAPKRGNLTLDDIRNAEKQAAESLIKKGFSNIKIINGKEISDKSLLNDKVHFTVEGAKQFAENLLKHLN